MRAVLRGIEYIALVLDRRARGFERGVCARLLTLTPRLVPRVLSRYGATVGPGARILSPLCIHNANSFRKLRIGASAFIGRDCLLDLKDEIEIGARATLAMRVTIVTHMDVGSSSWRERGYPSTSAPVSIGEDAYIGAGAILLPGVRIGAGALVGAATLVRRDVPPGARVGGVPARSLD